MSEGTVTPDQSCDISFVSVLIHLFYCSIRELSVWAEFPLFSVSYHRGFLILGLHGVSVRQSWMVKKNDKEKSTINLLCGNPHLEKKVVTVSYISKQRSFKLTVILLELNSSKIQQKVSHVIPCHLLQPSAQLHQLLFAILCNSWDRMISLSREMCVPYRSYSVSC